MTSRSRCPIGGEALRGRKKATTPAASILASTAPIENEPWTRKHLRLSLT